MESLREEKSFLRKQFLNRRDDLSEEERRARSEKIMAHLLAQKIYQDAKYIFTYLEMGSEVITSAFIQQALQDKKIVCLPVSVPKSRTMFFARLTDLNDTTKGAFNTTIPAYNGRDIRVSDGKTLIVVPGLVFTPYGFRLGYGGGYYDTYLSHSEYLCSCGVCFDFQVVDRIPKGRYDVRLDQIITEHGLVK